MMTDDADDDFALDTFEREDQLVERRKQHLAEETEPWWIVLHAKVAVRAAPTTDGKPLCTLPQGSVVRASGVQLVNGVRWIVVHDDDLLLLARPKNKKDLAAGPGTCMMIESTVAGRLLMVAPKEFPWDELSHMPPRERGEAARQRVLQAQGLSTAGPSSSLSVADTEADPDWTDEQIRQLLEEHDAMASQQAQQRATTAPSTAAAMARFIQPSQGTMMSLDDTV